MEKMCLACRINPVRGDEDYCKNCLENMEIKNGEKRMKGINVVKNGVFATVGLASLYGIGKGIYNFFKNKKKK